MNLNFKEGCQDDTADQSSQHEIGTQQCAGDDRKGHSRNFKEASDGDLIAGENGALGGGGMLTLYSVSLTMRNRQGLVVDPISRLLVARIR